MGHRLSKIYTRTGDNGSTGLADGSRMDKDGLRIQAMGDVDELNCVLGLLLTEPLSNELKDDLIQVQHILFNIGGECSLPGFALLSEDDISHLENRLDFYNENLAPLKEFILPGGSKAAAYAHLSRSVCRRAERKMVSLNKSMEKPHLIAQHYLNRLSDFLFVISRFINKSNNVDDVSWNNKFSRQK